MRLLTRTSPSLLVADPVVGKRFLPGFASRVFVPECDCEVDLRFNRDGLRGPDRPQAKPQGVRRIALVGDSMVAAVATAEESTLARRLEQHARRLAPGRDVGGDERGGLELEHRQRAGALPRGAVALRAGARGAGVLGGQRPGGQQPRAHAGPAALLRPRRRRPAPAAAVRLPAEPRGGVARPDEPPLRVAEEPRCGRRGRACAPGAGRWSRSSSSSRGPSRRRPPTRGPSRERCCARSRRRRGRAGRSWCSSKHPRPSRCTTTCGPSSRDARPGRGRRSRATTPKSGWASCAGRRGSRSWRSPPRSGPRPRTATRRGADEQLYYQGRFHWNDEGNALAAARVHDFARTMAP